MNGHFPLPQIKGMHARIRKKALIFLLRHGGMRGRELRNEGEARVKKKYSRDCDMGSLIWRFAAALAPTLLLIDSSLIPLICMLFPVSKQRACL